MITFNYDDILNRLKDNLQKKLGNSGILFYSTNQKLLEAIAEELAEQMRYNEYLTRESKWGLAENLSSIIYQSDFFNYVPHRKSGSIGELTVSTSEQFNGTYPRNILIPKFTQFSSSDLTFTSTAPVTLLSSLTQAKVPIIQGSLRVSTYEITSAYTEAELILLELVEKNPNIDNNHFEVRVNGDIWTKADDISFSTRSSSKTYSIKNLPDFSGVVLQFGEGFGKGLEYNDVVTFSYVETEGEDGEVLKTNAVNNVVDTLRDTQGRAVTLYCKNEGIIVGGSNVEDIESIRLMAPKTFSLISRVITKEDYSSYILNSEIVDKISVWGETEQNLDNNLPPGTFIEFAENLVNIAAISFSQSLIATTLTEAQRGAIRDLVSPVKGLTDIIRFVDPVITFLQFDVQAFYDNNTYSPDQVESAIQLALSTHYSIERTEFKQNLYFSQYYELINSLDEVGYHKTSLNLAQYMQNSEIEGSDRKIVEVGTTYEFPLTTFHNNVNQGSVKIFVKNIDINLDPDHPHADWLHIATDDGSGAFIGEIVPDEFSPSLNETYDVRVQTAGITEFRYEYGAVCDALGNTEGYKVIINNGMITGEENNYIIKVEFQAGEVGRTDVILTRREQIYAFESADITTDIL